MQYITLIENDITFNKSVIINRLYLHNINIIIIIVPEYGQCIYEDIQFDMHDVTYWTLVWMFTISSP